MNLSDLPGEELEYIDGLKMDNDYLCTKNEALKAENAALRVTLRRVTRNSLFPSDGEGFRCPVCNRYGVHQGVFPHAEDCVLYEEAPHE